MLVGFKFKTREIISEFIFSNISIIIILYRRTSVNSRKQKIQRINARNFLYYVGGEMTGAINTVNSRIFSDRLLR